MIAGRMLQHLFPTGPTMGRLAKQRIDPARPKGREENYDNG